MSVLRCAAVPRIFIHDSNMKVNSIIASKGKQRIGNVVLASYAGETIARQYNPDVYNPNTEDQRSTRARFKLMSQLGAVFAPVLAIPKKGLVSARNRFTSINFPITSFSDGQAQISLPSVQISDSNKPFVGFNADRTGADLVLKLDASGENLYDYVVYVAFTKNEYGDLIPYSDIVVNDPGEDFLFEGSMPKSSDTLIIYAYGLKAMSQRIKTKFYNMVTPDAGSIAKLIIASSENYNDSQITVTAGLTLEVGTDVADSDGNRYHVQSVMVGNYNITSTVPVGASFSAGENTAIVSSTGDLMLGYVVRWFDVTAGSAANIKRYTSSPAEIKATLEAGHQYYISVSFPDGNRFQSATITIPSE